MSVPYELKSNNFKVDLNSDLIVSFILSETSTLSNLINTGALSESLIIDSLTISSIAASVSG